VLSSGGDQTGDAGACTCNTAVVVPIELQTARLLLRRFESTDVADALAYRDDLEFARFLPHIPQPFTREHAEAFVALNMSEPWDESPTFAVVLDGQVIGTVNFEVEEAREAMIGYAIGRAWWGRGLATEATRAAIAWAVEAFDLARIWASTDAGNLRSLRVMEKLGMQREAVRVGDQSAATARWSTRWSTRSPPVGDRDRRSRRR
jgi:RimJ/RimL family protein N-acetyltransferase